MALRLPSDEDLLASKHRAARLYVRDERALPDSADPDRVNVTASERVVATLPAEYEPYSAWLPDYVQAFSATGTD